MLNSNLAHNLINILIAVVAALSLPEVVAVMPAEWAAPIAGVLAVVKLSINVVRDGVTGLVKQQPPVE